MGAQKWWIQPSSPPFARSPENCDLDCLNCFYLAPNNAGNGVYVTAWGCGQNEEWSQCAGAMYSSLNGDMQMDVAGSRSDGQGYQCTRGSTDVYKTPAPFYSADIFSMALG